MTVETALRHPLEKKMVPAKSMVAMYDSLPLFFLPPSAVVLIEYVETERFV
jgi:hypothetical protein